MATTLDTQLTMTQQTDVHSVHVNSFSYLLWAAAHFGCKVWEYLTTTYNNHWIGQGGPTAWPARSPDLTPMDFFLWGHIKALIYTSPVVSEEDLIALITEASTTIRQQPGIFEHMSLSAASLTAYQGQWPYIWTAALNWHEIQLFFQNTSVVLLNI